MIRWLRERLLPLVQNTLQNWSRDGGPRLVAATSYYAVFAFFPLLLVLISVLGYALRFSEEAQNAQQQVVRLVAQNASPGLAMQISGILDSVEAQATISGPLGLITLIAGALGVFAQIDRAFDVIWNAIPGPAGVLITMRRLLIERLTAFLLMLGMGLLILLLFLVGLVMAGIRSYAGALSLAEADWRLVQIAASVFLYTLAFTAVYKILPKPPVAWRDALVGGVFTALTWEAGRQVLAALVISQRYSAYGVVGSFMALMAWIYYGFTVFYLGAELAHTVSTRRRRIVLERGSVETADRAPRQVAAPPRPVAPSGGGKAAYALGGMVVGIMSITLTLFAALLFGILRVFHRE